MRRSGGCAGTSYAGNGQAAYENHQPEKILLPRFARRDTLVEVPDEVADAIVEESRAEDANDAKQHYHCYLSGRIPRHGKPFPGAGRFPRRIF